MTITTIHMEDDDELRRQNLVRVVATVTVERPYLLDVGAAQDLLADLNAALGVAEQTIQRTSIERWVEEHQAGHLVRWPNAIEGIRDQLPEEIRDKAEAAYVVVSVKL